MFEACHSVREVAEVYRRYGFGVSCAFERVSVVAGPRLGAVVMPSSLGERVHHRLLAVHACKSVPIVTFDRPNRQWVFLVGPALGRPSDARAFSVLDVHGIRVLEAGQRIWLPISDQSTGWRWVSPPAKKQPSPARTTVVAEVREQLSVASARSVEA